MTAGTEIDELATARAHVLETIAHACGRVGRDPASVTLVAVSKTVAAERLRSAVAAGLDRLAENRVQEGVAKAPLVPGATWELVGPLQSNKVRRAVETFARIQSIDSIELAERVDRIAGEVHPGVALPILLQVNIDEDPSKAGFAAASIADHLPALAELANLRVEGLMTIGRLPEDPEMARPTFRGLRELALVLRQAWPGLGPELSMGMSDDYAVAVEEGATIVRVGRALFGARTTA